MDKELDSIADDIIKDSFGSAAPKAPESPETPETSATPVDSEKPAFTSSGDPFSNRPPRAPSAPATPRETFTAEIPRQELPKRPLGNITKERTNEYNRIKEQMSAARDAREASGMSNPADTSGIVSMTPDTMPKQGLNKVILLFIILIPVVVVAAGVIIALLNQPTTSNNNNQNSNNKPAYVDPRDTAEKIDLSTYTSEIQIDKPGYYVLSGTTTFPIKVNADDEVTLYLNNVSVTATDASALSNFSTNHLVIFMDDGTENTLAVTDPNTFDSIYSEGDLTIDGGTGILNVTGIKIADGHHYDVTGNGIKDTKDVVITPENPEDSTASQPSEPTTQPAEGETVPQPAQPAEPAAQPAEPKQPATTR